MSAFSSLFFPTHSRKRVFFLQPDDMAYQKNLIFYVNFINDYYTA